MLHLELIQVDNFYAVAEDFCQLFREDGMKQFRELNLEMARS
jgi:hypothetical protein